VGDKEVERVMVTIGGWSPPDVGDELFYLHVSALY